MLPGDKLFQINLMCGLDFPKSWTPDLIQDTSTAPEATEFDGKVQLLLHISEVPQKTLTAHPVKNRSHLWTHLENMS